jgi:hypothetical protein
MAWRSPDRGRSRVALARLSTTVAVALVALVAVGVVACSRQPEIGSQADLDSLVARAGSVPPIDTVATTALPTIDPLSTDDLARAGRAGGSTPFGTNPPPPPIVVDTSPERSTSPFCTTLAGLLAHLGTRDLQRGARDVLDDGDQVRLLQAQAPGDGQVPVTQLLQAVQNLANGTPVTSPLVTVPLGQFADWVKHACAVVR